MPIAEEAGEDNLVEEKALVITGDDGTVYIDELPTEELGVAGPEGAVAEAGVHVVNPPTSINPRTARDQLLALQLQILSLWRSLEVLSVNQSPTSRPSGSAIPSIVPTSLPSISTIPTSLPSQRPLLSSYPSQRLSEWPPKSPMPSMSPSKHPSDSSVSSHIPSDVPEKSMVPTFYF